MKGRNKGKKKQTRTKKKTTDEKGLVSVLLIGMKIILKLCFSPPFEKPYCTAGEKKKRSSNTTVIHVVPTTYHDRKIKLEYTGCQCLA